MRETHSRMNVELSGAANGNFGGVSETHLLLRRLITQPTATPLVQSIRRLRASATRGIGSTNCIVTIPRHAQRFFHETISPRSAIRNRQPQSPHPKRRHDGASARWGRPNRNGAIESSRAVRRYQANGYLNAPNAFWFSARAMMEQH
jgi:hypothetical protein